MKISYNPPPQLYNRRIGVYFPFRRTGLLHVHRYRQMTYLHVRFDGNSTENRGHHLKMTGRNIRHDRDATSTGKRGRGKSKWRRRLDTRRAGSRGVRRGCEKSRRVQRVQDEGGRPRTVGNLGRRRRIRRSRRSRRRKRTLFITDYGRHFLKNVRFDDTV